MNGLPDWLIFFESRIKAGGKVFVLQTQELYRVLKNLEDSKLKQLLSYYRTEHVEPLLNPLYFVTAFANGLDSEQRAKINSAPISYESCSGMFMVFTKKDKPNFSKADLGVFLGYMDEFNFFLKRRQRQTGSFDANIPVNDTTKTNGRNA
jgi:hypothetical protein